MRVIRDAIHCDIVFDKEDISVTNISVTRFLKFSFVQPQKSWLHESQEVFGVASTLV